MEPTSEPTLEATCKPHGTSWNPLSIPSEHFLSPSSLHIIADPLSTFSSCSPTSPRCRPGFLGFVRQRIPQRRGQRLDQTSHRDQQTDLRGLEAVGLKVQRGVPGGESGTSTSYNRRCHGPVDLKVLKNWDVDI